MSLCGVLKEEEIKLDCANFTVLNIQEAIDIAKRNNDKELLEKYKRCERAGKLYVPFCKGSRSPDVDEFLEITSCKNCKDYTPI